MLQGFGGQSVIEASPQMFFALMIVLFERAGKGTMQSNESSSWMRERFSRLGFRFARELQVHSSIASKVADAKAVADFRGISFDVFRAN